MNDFGNKTGEIPVNKKYIYANFGLYAIAGLVIFFAAPFFIKGIAPIGFIFLAVGLFPLTKLNAKVELYEKGFAYGKKKLRMDIDKNNNLD
jgi:hypothetical protein